MIYKLLTEDEFEGVKYDTELCEDSNQKRMYISGIALQGNIQNKNGRTYPEQVLDEAINNYINETNSLAMSMEGELKHPKQNAHEINEDRISHRFVDVVKEGVNWRTKALILDTSTGKQVQNLINGGVKLGQSSRCLGQLKEGVVQKGLKVVTPADIVRRPSAPDAIIDAIYENKEWIYENGVLIEKDIEPELDMYKQMIDKTTKNDRAKIFESIILDYFKKIEIS